MKRFNLDENERHSLFEMGMWHPHPRVRRRAQALVRLAEGMPRAQLAVEFEVHLNSVNAWIRRWRKAGLAGLYELPHEGRPTKLSPVVEQRLRQIALAEGDTISQLMQHMEEAQMPLLVRPETVARWLKGMGFSYKRYRTSLKKSAIPTWLPTLRSNLKT